MGFNTAVMFCNDGFDQIQRYPDDFIEGISRNMNRGGEFGVGHHGNVAQVIETDHADAIQLIAVGGNHATKVHTGFYVGDHHTEEGQLALLRQWADRMGYHLTRKRQR